MATFNFQKFKQIRNFLFFFNTTTMRKSQVASSTRTMNLVANNLSKSCFMTACSSNSFNTVLDVMKVYYYQVQFNVVQSEVEYLLDPYTSTKRHFYTLSTIILLHLLQKSQNWCSTSPLAVYHEYPN